MRCLLRASNFVLVADSQVSLPSRAPLLDTRPLVGRLVPHAASLWKNIRADENVPSKDLFHRVVAAKDPSSWPYGHNARPEVAFVGTKNAGKSALLVSFVGSDRKPDDERYIRRFAAESPQPGASGKISFVRAFQSFDVVDTMGYGSTGCPASSPRRLHYEMAGSRQMMDYLLYSAHYRDLRAVVWVLDGTKIHAASGELSDQDVEFFRKVLNTLPNISVVPVISKVRLSSTPADLLVARVVGALEVLQGASTVPIHYPVAVDAHLRGVDGDVLRASVLAALTLSADNPLSSQGDAPVSNAVAGQLLLSNIGRRVVPHVTVFGSVCVPDPILENLLPPPTLRSLHDPVQQFRRDDSTASQRAAARHRTIAGVVGGGIDADTTLGTEWKFRGIAFVDERTCRRVESSDFWDLNSGGGEECSVGDDVKGVPVSAGCPVIDAGVVARVIDAARQDAIGENIARSLLDPHLRVNTAVVDAHPPFQPAAHNPIARLSLVRRSFSLDTLLAFYIAPFGVLTRSVSVPNSSPSHPRGRRRGRRLSFRRRKLVRRNAATTAPHPSSFPACALPDGNMNTSCPSSSRAINRSSAQIAVNSVFASTVSAKGLSGHPSDPSVLPTVLSDAFASSNSSGTLSSNTPSLRSSASPAVSAPQGRESSTQSLRRSRSRAAPLASDPLYLKWRRRKARAFREGVMNYLNSAAQAVPGVDQLKSLSPDEAVDLVMTVAATQPQRMAMRLVHRYGFNARARRVEGRDPCLFDHVLRRCMRHLNALQASSGLQRAAPKSQTTDMTTLAQWRASRAS